MANKAKFQILNKDQAFKLADSIAKTAAKTAAQIQTLCLTGIGYANVHGDVTVATRLLTVVGKATGLRRQAMVNIMEAFGCLKWDKDHFEHVKRDDVIRDPAQLVVEMSKPENFWTEFTPEPEVVSSVDALELVQRLVKRIAKLQKDGAEVLHDDVYAKLTQLADAAE